MELESSKCASCEDLKSRLSQEEAESMLRQTPGWEMSGDTISRELKFPNFIETMRFANRVTKIAEEENHHPDLHISYGKMKIELNTHSVGGLSTNDFILASKINNIWNDQEQHEQAI